MRSKRLCKKVRHWYQNSQTFVYITIGQTMTEEAIKIYDQICIDGGTWEQFTGIHDKNGTQIFEGDLIRYRYPYRSTQTHTGDNIPNGSYTEPMDPEIMEIEAEVCFKYGMYCICDHDDPGMDDCTALSYIDYSFDEGDIKESIAFGGKDIFDWTNGTDGDLEYLLGQYDLKSLDDLIEYLRGIQVIGNIHETKQS